MKKILLLAFLFVYHIHSNAQFAVVAKGPAFEEPEKGYCKILLLKNKTTAYLHIESDGISVKLYGADYKPAGTSLVTSSQGKLSELDVESIFEINGNIVLMLSEYEKNVPILYRFVIDGKTGRKISEEKIAELSKEGIGSFYANTLGDVPLADFIVRKNPNADNYCLILYNTTSSKTYRRIEFITYNNEHKEISRVFLNTPENKFKYLNILDAAVLDNNEAYALLYAYNTKSSGGKENDLLLASFKPGDKEINYINLDNDDDKKVIAGLLKYNEGMKKLMVLSCVYMKTKQKAFSQTVTYYDIPMQFVDPVTKSVQKHEGLELSAVDAKHRELFGKNDYYMGMLQNVMIDDDGGFSVILEGLLSVSTTHTQDDFYGSIAVLNYNKSGKLLSSALIPKKQEYNNNALSGGGIRFAMGAKAVRLTQKSYFGPLYHRDRDWKAAKLGGGNQYKSFAYLNGKDKNYILFNDVEENGEKILKGKLINIQGVKDCDAFAFETTSGNILPTRKFIFNNPSGKKEHNLGVLTVSDYDKESNLYATLKLEIDGRDKKVRLVWLKP